MKIAAQIIACLYWIAAAVFAVGGGLQGLVLIIVADHVVNHILVSVAKGRTAIILSFTAMILFIIWSVAFCAWVLLNPEGPDSVIGIFFTSIFAFPVLVPFWLGTVWTTVRAHRREAQNLQLAESPSPM